MSEETDQKPAGLNIEQLALSAAHQVQLVASNQTHEPQEYRIILSAITAATEQLRTELAETKAALADPKTVHANILRGTIALTRDQALHIAGATDYDSLRAEVEQLTETLNNQSE